MGLKLLSIIIAVTHSNHRLLGIGTRCTCPHWDPTFRGLLAHFGHLSLPGRTSSPIGSVHPYHAKCLNWVSRAPPKRPKKGGSFWSFWQAPLLDSLCSLTSVSSPLRSKSFKKPEYDSYLLPLGALEKQSKFTLFLLVISLQTCSPFLHPSPSKCCFSVPGAWQTNRSPKSWFQWCSAFSQRWFPCDFVHPCCRNATFVVQGCPEKQPSFFMAPPSDYMTLSTDLWYPSLAKSQFLETLQSHDFKVFKLGAQHDLVEFV